MNCPKCNAPVCDAWTKCGVCGHLRNPPTEIVGFYESEHYMFSNFSAFAVRYQGRDWMTSEHAYQAMKFSEPWFQEWIRCQKSAHDAKAEARLMREFIRRDWDAHKVNVMAEIIRCKLGQHPYIFRKLMKTGRRELIETSPHDAFWGWGPNKDGQNHLGKIWMALRDELRPDSCYGSHITTQAGGR